MNVSNSKVIVVGETPTKIDLVVKNATTPGFTRVGPPKNLGMASEDDNCLMVTCLSGKVKVGIGDIPNSWTPFKAQQEQTVGEGKTAWFELNNWSNSALSCVAIGNQPAILAIATGIDHAKVAESAAAIAGAYAAAGVKR